MGAAKHIRLMISKTLLVVLALTLASQGRPWTNDVIYFAMTDRFCDGDPANNVPPGSDPSLHDADQAEISQYLGGDLRGLENALQAGYFNDLGVTALWLTPVVRNVWRSGFDLGGAKTGYHGYWAQDWLDIDPHLTSKGSLTGMPYSDNAEGRMKHYRDFVELAHSKGIKVIQDAVLNHAGTVFHYDANGDGVFNLEKKEEWIQPFLKTGIHDNAKWADVPKWNARRTLPDGPRELLGVKIATKGTLAKLDVYGRKGFSPDSLGKSDGEEVTCDFFSLRDFWTDPKGAHFDALVDEFVAIYRFYLTTVGVDGLRIDTVKHAHPEFWDAFTERLRKRLGSAAAEKILFGEVYDGNPARLGQYTWRSNGKEPALDSVLDFNFCFNAREYLRLPGRQFGSPAALEKSLGTRTQTDTNQRPFYNPNPGADGLNSQQKIITFIENHDGLNRFRVSGVTGERNRLAQALLMTLPGIPCLYYGTEFDLLDTGGKVGGDGETGRMMFYRRKGGPTIMDVKSSPAFSNIAKLAALRAKLPVLRTGKVIPLWVDSPSSAEDDGVFAFARASDDGKTFAVVVMNASDKVRITSAGAHHIQLPPTLKTAGKMLRAVLTVGEGEPLPAAEFDAAGPLRLPAPPSGMVVYSLIEAD